MARPRLDEPTIGRHDILEAAGRLFRERGYERTSLKAIGAQVGVSGQAILYHFPTKAEVLFSYLETGLHEALRRGEEARSATASPADQLRQLIRNLVLIDLGALPGSEIYAAGAYGYYQLILSLSPEQRRQLDRLQNDYLDLLRSAIREATESGEFEPVNVTLAAFAVTGMATHALHWFRSDGKLTAHEVADLYADFATRMLRRPQEAARVRPRKKAAPRGGASRPARA